MTEPDILSPDMLATALKGIVSYLGDTGHPYPSYTWDCYEKLERHVAALSRPTATAVGWTIRNTTTGALTLSRTYREASDAHNAAKNMSSNYAHYEAVALYVAQPRPTAGAHVSEDVLAAVNALKKYARHSTGCLMNQEYADSACICGLTAAMRRAAALGGG